MGRGSEQAFGRGFEDREIENGVLARRWASGRLLVSFLHLPAGPVAGEIELRSQRHPVLVSGGGAVLATLPPGATSARFSLPEARGGRLDLELAAQTFVARGGRRLGFILDRVLVNPSPPGPFPPPGLLAAMALPALAALLVGGWVALSRGESTALAALLLGTEVALLFRYGLARSPYVGELSFWLVAGLLLSAIAARGIGRLVREGEEAAPVRRSAFFAVLAAFLVQGVLAAHPCLVASDAVFHAHNLQAVANGDFSLLSLTPHDPPFRFPYGVSFYVLLVPLLHSGLELTTLVRFGASASAVLAAAALFALLAPQGPRRAGLAVLLLQLLPATFDLLSAGNYTNVFAQSSTLVFLAWWTGSAPGGSAVGALLLALGATAHFGGLLFLLALSAVLAVMQGRRLDRTRGLALVAGLGAAGAYYAQFLGLLASQVPRLLATGEGGGAGLLGGVLVQLGQAVVEWGLPLVLLAALGLWASRGKGADRVARGLVGLALAGAPFLVAAAGSALELRYLYAVAPAVAVLAADGLLALGPRPRGRVLGGLALLAQAALAVSGLARAVFERYRGA